MNKLKFLTTFFKDYRIGAFSPSSKHVAQRITSEIRSEYRNLVEYGPGEGVVTRGLLRSLPVEGRVVAIETNRDFVESLRIIGDSRLTVISGDVGSVISNPDGINLPSVDVVVSGIPFSFIKPAARERVIKQTHDLLSERGRFIVYQHSRLVEPILKKYFRTVRRYYEIRNFLPYFVMVAEK